jgi:PIN domain nuclease of toxin-antitoxin system
MPIVKTLKQHKLLLDTHIWIWYCTGAKAFSQAFQKAIEYNRERHSVLLSPMSIWELGMLSEKGKVRLGMDLLDWVLQSIEATRFRILQITPRIAIESSRLPGTSHGDPVDRLLIATAHEENAVLITCDEKILSYSLDKYVNAHNPC